jgi:hypothetical protein
VRIDGGGSMTRMVLGTGDTGAGTVALLRSRRHRNNRLGQAVSPRHLGH